MSIFGRHPSNHLNDFHPVPFRLRWTGRIFLSREKRRVAQTGQPRRTPINGSSRYSCIRVLPVSFSTIEDPFFPSDFGPFNPFTSPRREMGISRARLDRNVYAFSAKLLLSESICNSRFTTKPLNLSHISPIYTFRLIFSNCFLIYPSIRTALVSPISLNAITKLLTEHFQVKV